MVENIKSQMRKGILEFSVLSIISRTNEAYTSDILSALQEADLLVVEGTLYPLLTRLKNNGILSYRWQESKDGPPRKYYRLTEEGYTLLDGLQQEWNAISRSINGITMQNSGESPLTTDNGGESPLTTNNGGVSPLTTNTAKL